ncbi:MAG: proton-conducting transporter membrane subunit, partial [Armatimonadota bacterium]
MAGEINMQSSALPWLVVAVPVVFGLLVLLAGRLSRVLREPLAFVGVVATAAVSIQATQEVLAGHTLIAWGELLLVDGLSALVQLIGCLMTVLILLYSLRYIPRHLSDENQTPGKLSNYYGLLLVFLGMLNFTCITNHMVLLYLSVEAATLVTALLVVYYRQKPALEAGYKYLVLVGVGVTFALLGCVFLYSGGLQVLPAGEALLLSSLGRVAKHLPTGVALLAAAFLVAGFGTKAGLMPFHAWLPDAHSEAPTPISAL